MLPHDISKQMPRRGRTTAEVWLEGHHFQILLEPDGNKSHWFKLEDTQLQFAGVNVSDEVRIKIKPVDQEPEPEVPKDLKRAIQSSHEAQNTWQATTTLARLDWIHWVTSAKQRKTRTQRIAGACQMLAEGKKRVCCFDPSGFYSKAFKAPEAME